MPTRTQETPARQQDRAPRPGSRPKDEPRNLETPAGWIDGNPDSRAEVEDRPIEDPDINTHGSER